MFEFASFVSRNPLYSLKNWRALSSVRKALLEKRLKTPECEWCGRTHRLEVHHTIPVWAEPILAASAPNLVTLCRKCHLYVGHNGSFSDRFEQELPYIIKTHKVAKKLKFK